MQQDKAIVGQRVICNGHPGAIREVCEGQLSGMAVVQLGSGQVCVDINGLIENGE